MNTKQHTATFYSFIVAGLLAVIALVMRERVAFIICAGVADIMGIALVANIVANRIKRRRVL